MERSRVKWSRIDRAADPGGASRSHLSARRARAGAVDITLRHHVAGLLPGRHRTSGADSEPVGPLVVPAEAELGAAARSFLWGLRRVGRPRLGFESDPKPDS